MHSDSMPGSAAIRFLILGLGLLACTQASADYAAGQAAMEAGDHAGAFHEWREAASNGFATALFGLGEMYEKGVGVPADPYTAFVLYRVAMNQGDPRGEAQANVVANRLTGPDLARGIEAAARLTSTRKYLPALPGAPADSRSTQARVPVPPPPPPKPAAAPRPASASAAPPAPPVPGSAAAARAMDVRYTCALQLRWQDKGSGGRSDLAIFAPVPESGYFSVGHYAQAAYDVPYGCAATVRPLPGAAPDTLAAPARWERVWRDKGTGSSMDGSIWRAVSPDAEHVCVGHVGQRGYDAPAVPEYRCVHRSLIGTLRPTNPIWTTAGTGGRDDVEIYVLPHVNSFIAVPPGSAPAQMQDLDPNAGRR